MTYLEVLTDICSRVADPELDSYKERAKDHFLRAIMTIVEANAYTENDIKGYLKLKTDLVFSTNPYDASALKLFKILEIMPDPLVPNDFSAYLKEFSELNLMSQIAELQPKLTDVFIYQVGINIYAVYNTSASNFTVASDTFYMKYIEDIDGSAWTDSTDLTATPIFFNDSFIRRAIEIASKTLLDEVNL